MKNEEFHTIGIDGGASNTRGVLVNHLGETISTFTLNLGTNLSVYGETAAERIVNVISKLSTLSNIPFDSIDAIGLGLAGASSNEGRDQVFKKLDALNLSKRTLIANDAETAYLINCPTDRGVLVTVGTGIICIAKNNDGKIIRIAGQGHDKGDIGSGFWIGKQIISNLALNETSVMGDAYLEELMDLFLQTMDSKNFNSAVEKVYEHNEQIKMIAELAKPLIECAGNGNEIALSILQEATHSVANYIKHINDELNYSSSDLVLAGNGSIIKNDKFRKSVNDELCFDYSDIKWTFSKISSAYGAAMMAASLYDVNIEISDILKGGKFVSS